MADLPLTNDPRVAVIDDDLLDAALVFRWRNHRPADRHLTVARTYRDGARVKSQTLASFVMGGPPPEGHVWAHLNGDPLDHRRENLAAVRRGQHFTHEGRAKVERSEGRFAGVSRAGSRYRARLKIGDRQVTLGTFATEEEAARAYDAARREHLGLPPVNFPE